jgi:lipopolysaccharide export system protein LptA
MSGRKSRVLRLILAGAALALASASLPAETFSFSGDSSTMTLAEGGQRALLTGHGRVESADLRITADSIELFGKDFTYAQARGNVRVVDARRGLDLTSQELFYDRDKKIARVRGNATLADLKNEMVVKGGFIEDQDKEQITIVQIGVRIFRKDIVCRSEFARYQRDKKILELSGMPWVSKGGDVYQAARITINLDTEEITLEGSVQGKLEDKSKESTGEAAPEKTTPPPEGGTAPQSSSPKTPPGQPPAGQAPPQTGPGAPPIGPPANPPSPPPAAPQGTGSGS